ncbi:MAG: hypothetical protein D6767_03915 [Candidatus Hydrogenedentota bacterium]|nr:MAG: hypothetical protein D6767_03915 [Candidatus Hydrogenedentota bacterium]
MRGMYILLSLFFLARPIFSGQLKKVLILDIKNIDEDPTYQYLEPSITDAVRNELKKRFIFRETKKDLWQKVAKENYIYLRDLYTDTAAINLGLLARQDIVIAGGYKVRLEEVKSKKKKKKYKTKMTVKVRIYDIAKRSVPVEIVATTPVTNNLFEAVDRIAMRIADEAKKVLPNKDEWEKKGLSPDQETSTANQLTLLGGIGVAVFPDTFSEISSRTILYREVLPQNINLGLEYTRKKFFYDNVFIFTRATYQFGSKTLRIQNTSEQALLKQVFWTASLGLGYRIFIFKKLYSKILAGGGYSIGQLSLDFSSLENKPTKLENNQPTNEETYKSSAPFSSLDLRFGYTFANNVSLETGANLNTYYFKGHMSHLLTANLGMGVHF